MGNIVYGAALGNFGFPLDFFDASNFTALTATAHRLTVVDGNGAQITIRGSGLAYTDGKITGGTLTGFAMQDPGGAAIYAITNANLDAASVASSLITDQEIFPLLAGADLVTGSALRDVMAGGAGDDTLMGGGGADFLFGMAGRDEMTGGAGRDMFAFAPFAPGARGGTDYVMDFHDTGAATDDLIALRRADYDAMVISKSGHDVLLDFGAKGSLVIVGATVGQIGLDDFVFHFPVF